MRHVVGVGAWWLVVFVLPGTQNASFLSVSGRSAECQHTKVLDKCLPVAGLSAEMTRRCLALTPSAKNFGIPRWQGNAQVAYVLYRGVFSIVNFLRNQPTCVTPGCRVFSRRCGHVRITRRVCDGIPRNVHDHCGAADAINAGSKASMGPSQRAMYFSHEEEDDGVEKQPLDTVRADADGPQARVCDRRMRNLLPCKGDLEMGEV